MIKVSVRSRPDRESLQLAWTDPMTGQVKTRSAGTSDWKKAERNALKLEIELSQGAGAPISWDRFRIRFEDEYLAPLSRSTKNEYLGTLRKFESMVGCVRAVSSINASVCSEFQSKMRNQKISEATIAKHLRQLKVALNWAVTIGVLSSAPKIRKPKASKNSMKGRPITLVEFCKFLIAIKNSVPAESSDHWVNLLKAIWLTGLRLGEAVQLRFDSGPVQIDIESDNPRLIFKSEGQKNRTDEMIPLTPDAIRFFRRFTTREGYLFELGGSRSKRFILSNISKLISAAGEASGIRVGSKFVSAHDLRRTFGNRWALRVHPIVLKTLMRHSDLKTTLKYYVDLDCDSIADQLKNVHTNVHGKNFKP